MTQTSPLPLVPMLLATCVLPAQQTSPSGFGAADGSSRILLMGGNQRLQQIDNTHVGTPRLIQGLAFRRDDFSSPGSPTGLGTRRLEVRVRLDTVPMGLLVDTFDENLVAPVEVLPRSAVMMPDWTVPPGGGPAPFDFVIDFAVPYSYPGGQALLIDVDWNNLTSTAPVWFDAEEDGYEFSDPVEYGQGCVQDPTGFGPYLSVLVGNGGPGMPHFGYRISPRVQNGEPLSPVFLLVGLTVQNLSTSGLCGTVYTDGILATILIGDTDAFGLLDFQHLSFPYGAGLVGTELVFQTVQPEIASTLPFPFALSNGTRSTVPPATATDVPECAYHFADVTTDPDGAYGEVRFGAGIVIELR